MKKKNGGNSLWDLRRTMKTRRVICNSGPASQFTYVNQFIALRTRNVRKHTYPPTAVQHLFWRSRVGFMNSASYAIELGGSFWRGTRASGRYHQQLPPPVLLEWQNCRAASCWFGLRCTTQPVPQR